MNIEPIAYFRSPFATKFGVPKQSGLVEGLRGTIEFVAEYRNADALRGIEGFDYLWLVWEFSANRHATVSPVVRPPLLGGNVKMGVFATRSPYRPNRIGLSSVRISGVELSSPRGPLVHVLGADLMDGTPIYDIKPYVVYADCHPDARSGFVDTHVVRRLNVVVPDDICTRFAPQEVETLRKVLELDPRPQYHGDSKKVYGMEYGGVDVKFRVESGVLTIVGMERRP